MSIEVAEVVDQKYQVSEYRSIEVSKSQVQLIELSSAVSTACRPAGG